MSAGRSMRHPPGLARFLRADRLSTSSWTIIDARMLTRSVGFGQW